MLPRRAARPRGAVRALLRYGESDSHDRDTQPSSGKSSSSEM